MKKTVLTPLDRLRQLAYTPLAADEKRLQFSGGSPIFAGLRRWGAELKGKSAGWPVEMRGIRRLCFRSLTGE